VQEEPFQDPSLASDLLQEMAFLPPLGNPLADKIRDLALQVLLAHIQVHILVVLLAGIQLVLEQQVPELVAGQLELLFSELPSPLVVAVVGQSYSACSSYNNYLCQFRESLG
jgi:hypothetical protein